MSEHEVNKSVIGATDSELILCSQIAREVGQKSIPQAKLYHDRVKTKLDNRVELEKVKDKSPTMTNVELVTLVTNKIEAEKELRDFDWLKFDQALSELLHTLIDELQKADKQCKPSNTRNDMDFAREVVWRILEFADMPPKSSLGKKYTKRQNTARTVFEKWLSAKGAIGCSGLQKKKSGKFEKLPEGVIYRIKDIVEARGLQEGIFTEAQLKDMGLIVTVNNEEEVKGRFMTFRK